MQRPSPLKAVVAYGMAGLPLLSDAPAKEEVTYAHQLDPFAWAVGAHKLAADVKTFMPPDAAWG